MHKTSAIYFIIAATIGSWASHAQSTGSSACNNNGMWNPGEVCDNGPAPGCTETPSGSGYICSVDVGWQCFGAMGCSPKCGDGLIVGSEACDDGNMAGNDGCSPSCTVEYGWQCNVNGCTTVCGDGILVGNETCDDGNTTSGDGCSSTCAIETGWQCFYPGGCSPICGDGNKLGNEQCDDGNTSNSDGCSSTCAIETGWQCVYPGGCSPICGDGSKLGNEQCDDGNTSNNDGCSSTCSIEAGWQCTINGCASICGDTLLVGSEQCDDGNTSNDDGCSSSCTSETGWQCSPNCAPICGDGVVLGDEECDDGANNSNVLPDRCRTSCVFPFCGDAVEDTGELCDWGPDNGSSSACLTTCDGYADFAFQNGEDIELSLIPGVIALFASETFLEQVCLLADAQDAENFSARQVSIAQWSILVGRITVAETTQYVDDPVVFYNDSRELDGRSLAHIEAPFFEVVPGRYFIEAGTLIATSLHGGVMPSASCPCSSGGSFRQTGCEIEMPGFNPDPCGNPYSSPSDDRLVDGLTYCPAMSMDRSDFGGAFGGCRSSCLVMGSPVAGCTPDQITVPLPPAENRGDCTVRSVIIDELCTHVRGAKIGSCPGYCEGHASDVCGTLFASDGELPRDATCGIMTNAIAIAGPDSECVEDPLDVGNLNDALSRGGLSLRESWTACLATPQSPACVGRRVPLAPPGGEFGSLVDTTEVTLAACLGENDGLCALCSQEGLGKGCLPVVDLRNELAEVVIVPRGGMHGSKVDHEGRAAAMSRLAMRLRGPDPRVASDDDDLSKPEATPDNATDPVSLATGELLLEAEDFSFPSRDVELSFTRHYRSGGARSGAFGPGWTHVYEERIEPIGDPDNRANMPKYCVAALPAIHCLLHHDGRGGSHLYVLDERNHVFVPSPGAFGTIAVWARGAPEAIGAGPVYRLRERDGSVKVFDWLSGLMLKTVDEKGFGVSLEYEMLTALEVEEQGSAFDVGPTDMRPRSPVSFAAKSAHRDRVNRINRLKLVRLKDAFGRHIRLDYDTYQLHVTPTSAPDSHARRRRLVSATYENPPHGPEEVLVTWDYVENNLTNEAYLSRATRSGMTQALSPATPLVTDYEYAHELFDNGFAYGMNGGTYSAPLGQEIAVLFDQMAATVSDCVTATPTVSAAFPELADPLCGQRWRLEDQPVSLYVNNGALLMGMLREMLADNIVRVWRGDTVTQTLELESFFEVDPRRPEFDRVTQQRFGMLPAPLTTPESVNRDGSLVHQWHTSMPTTSIYAIEGKLVPDAKIPFVHSQEGEIDNPRTQASFVVAGRAVPAALLSALPLTTHGPSPADLPGAPPPEPLCMDLTKQTPVLEVVKPAGDRSSFVLTNPPTLARTEQTCAAIAARWSRDAFSSDLVDPRLFVKELASISRFGLRRELLAWDMNLACQFVQVVDRRNVSTTYALNFLGQPLAIAAPAPNGSMAVTTWTYTADGLQHLETRPDGGRTTISYAPEASSLHAAGSTLTRPNIYSVTEQAATAAHLVATYNETSTGTTTFFISRATTLQYEPLYQRAQSTTHPDGVIEYAIFDYQQLSSTSPAARLLMTLFNRQTGAEIPTSAFLNVDYDGDGTSAGETGAGEVLRYVNDVSTGPTTTATIGTRTRRDETGRMTRTTQIASLAAPASDSGRVDYIYYPDVAHSEIGALSSAPCDCPRGPLAKTIRYRTLSSSTANDRDERFLVYDPVGGVRLTQENDHHESDVISIRDSLGRVIEIESPGDDHRLTTSYSYDKHGYLASTIRTSTDIETQVVITPHAQTGELLGTCIEHGAGACAGFEAFTVLATQKHRLNSPVPTFIGNAGWRALLYDVDDELGQVIDAEGGSTRYVRNDSGALVEERTEASPPFRNSYVYDVLGRQLTARRTATDGTPVLAMHHQFDRFGRLVARQTRTAPNLASFTTAQGTIERWGYDMMDAVTRESISGPSGSRRSLSFRRIARNELGTPLAIHDYAATLLSESSLPTVSATYSHSTSDSWVTRRQQVDNQLRPVVIGIEGLTNTTVTWDDFGPTTIDSAAVNLQIADTPRLRSDTIIRHPKGEGTGSDQYVTKVTHRNGLSLPREVRVKASDDGVWRIHDIRHDALGREVRRVGPDQRGFFLEYDAAGRVVSSNQSWNGTPVRNTSYEYDLLGRVIEETPMGAPPTLFSYDTSGALTSQQSGDTTTTYSRDAAGRLLRRQLVTSGALREYEHVYSAGQWAAKELIVDGMTAKAYVHDGLDRIITAKDYNLVTAVDSSSATFRSSRPQTSTTLQRDTLGRIIRESTSGAFPSASPTLPNRSRVLSTTEIDQPLSLRGPTSVSFLGGETTYFTYYGSGSLSTQERRTTPTVRLGVNFNNIGGLWVRASLYLYTQGSSKSLSLTKNRDSFGGVISSRMDGTAIRDDVLRNSAGRIAAERRATVRLTSLGTSGKSFQYDGLGRLGQVNIDQNTSVTVDQFNSHRSNVVSMETGTPFSSVDATQAVQFTDADALTSLTSDELGRTHSAVIQNALDGVPTTSANGLAVAYDSLRRIVATQDLQLTYDALDRLVLVMRGSTEELRLVYDGLGRRVVERSRIGSQSVDRTLVYYEGNVVQEMNPKAIPSLDTVAESVMYAPGLDTPIAHIDGPVAQGAVAHALLTNSRGDVIASRNLSNNSITQEAHYDAYGERLIGQCVEGKELNGTASKPAGSSCSGGILGRFGIAGGRAHARTKLVDLRNRVYAPHLKGFLTKDPLGPIDSYALYSYAAGDPLNLRDPLGLSVKDSGVSHVLGPGGGVPSTVSIPAEWTQPVESTTECDIVCRELRMQAEFLRRVDTDPRLREKREALALAAIQKNESLWQRTKDGVRDGASDALGRVLGALSGAGEAWDGAMDTLGLGDLLVGVSIGARRRGDHVLQAGHADETYILNKSRDVTGVVILSAAPAVGRFGTAGARAATRAAPQAPKLLSAVPKSVQSAANHIFGRKSLAKHKLEPVLDAFGGDAVTATYRLQNAAQGLANQGAIKGVFETTVDVAGHNVTVRGAVIDGVAHLRTAFIP